MLTAGRLGSKQGALRINYLRQCRTRKIVLLLPLLWISFLSIYTVFWDFILVDTVFNMIGGSIVSPFFMSLHIGGSIIAWIGLTWLVLATGRNGAGLTTAAVLFLMVLLLAATTWITRDQGRTFDHAEFVGPWIGLTLGLYILYFIFSLVPPLLPQLVRPSRETKMDEWYPLPVRQKWFTGILIAALLVGWFVFARIASVSWDPNEGFDTPTKYLAGATLPLMFASAGLMVPHFLSMGIRARRILYWITVFLQAVALVTVLVLSARALFYGSWETIPVIVGVVLLHAFWLWVSLEFLVPLYGFEWQWHVTKWWNKHAEA